MKVITSKKTENINILVFGIFCFFIIAAHCSAQKAVFTIKDALNAAEKNYPALKAAGYYTQSASENLKSVRRQYIPALKLHQQITYATANSLTGTYFPYGVVVPVSGGITSQNYDEAAYGSISLAYFEWPFFAFGQQNAQNKIAQSELKFAQAGEANEKFQLFSRVSEAYLDLLALQKLEKSQIDNLQRAETILRLVRAATKSGLKPGVDSSFANAEVAKAQLGLLDVQKSEMLQKSVLATLLGNNIQNITLDTTFLARLPVEISTDTTLANHPLLEMYNEQVQISKARENSIKLSYLPKISLLGATWGRGSGMDGANPSLADESFSGGTALTRFDYAVGLAATFNILDYPRMRAAANSEYFNTQAINSEEDQEKLNLQNDLTAANQNLQYALLEAKIAPQELKAASDAYTQKLTLYNNGLAPLSDLAQALYNLNKADADLAVINNAAWKALLFRANTIGNLNIFINQVQ